MTRKQVLAKVLEILDKPEILKTLSQNSILDMKEKINGILEELPITNWTEATIHDTVRQFAIDHGRNPTVYDMERRKKMPPHATIKLRFGISMKEFLDQYYPPKCTSKVYRNYSREELLADFVSRYQEIKPYSSGEYNHNRRAGMPCWATVARLYEIKKWHEFLAFNHLLIYVKGSTQSVASVGLFKVETVGGIDAIERRIHEIDLAIEGLCMSDGAQ